MRIVLCICLIASIVQLQAQQDYEQDFGFKPNLISETDKLFIDSLVLLPVENQLHHVIDKLSKGDLKPIMQALLLEIYLKPEYLNDQYFLEGLRALTHLKLDKNVYLFKVGMSKSFYPILLFLLEQNEDSIYSVEDLLQSDFLRNCQLFNEWYEKQLLSKQLIEWIIKNEGVGFRELQKGLRDSCSQINFKFLSESCEIGKED